MTPGAHESAPSGHVPAEQPPIRLVGVPGGRIELLNDDARAALTSAEVLLGEPHLLRAFRRSLAPGTLPGLTPRLEEVGPGVEDLVRRVRQHGVFDHQRVGVLLAGDPGFFGLLSALCAVVDRASVSVHPAAPLVSDAFANVAIPWEDAVVVASAHVSLDHLVGIARTAPKVAVLTDAGMPPESVGRALLDAGVKMDLVAVCSAMGTDHQRSLELDLAALAAGSFEPPSVVILIGPGGLPLVGWASIGTAQGDAHGATFGLEAAGALQAEAASPGDPVAAVLFDTLDLPGVGVFWQLGSDAYDMTQRCARWRPGLTVLVMDRPRDPTAGSDADTPAGPVERGRTSHHRISGADDLRTLDLPAPDRVLLVDAPSTELDGVLARLRPGGRIVATYGSPGAAQGAADRLGNLIMVHVARALAAGEGSGLASESPVFIAWGPER